MPGANSLRYSPHPHPPTLLSPLVRAPGSSSIKSSFLQKWDEMMDTGVWRSSCRCCPPQCSPPPHSPSEAHRLSPGQKFGLKLSLKTSCLLPLSTLWITGSGQRKYQRETDHQHKRHRAQPKPETRESHPIPGTGGLEMCRPCFSLPLHSLSTQCQHCAGNQSFQDKSICPGKHVWFWGMHSY